MCLDYIEGGELFVHLRRYEKKKVYQVCIHLFRSINRLGNFNEDFVRFYSVEVILAIAYLHQHDIIYRDLKVYAYVTIHSPSLFFGRC